QKSVYNQRFTNWLNGTFYPQNPAFAAKIKDLPNSSVTAQGQIKTLRRLVDDVKDMLASYDAYHAAIQANPGNSTAATVKRKSITGAYANYMEGAVKK